MASDKQTLPPPPPVPPGGFGGPPIPWPNSQGFLPASNAVRAMERWSPTTPDLLAARYVETGRINRLTLRDADGWRSVTVDRPTILVPVGATAAALIGQCWYAPHDIPIDPYAGGNEEANAISAFGPGVMYLWAPGRWHVRYTGTAGRDWLHVPAEDPGIAVALLSRTGLQDVIAATNNLAASATAIIAARSDRRGLFIQHNGANSTRLLIGLGFTPNTGATPLETGILLTPNGSLTLAGDTNYRGVVNLGASATNLTGTVAYTVLEFV